MTGLTRTWQRKRYKAIFNIPNRRTLTPPGWKSPNQCMKKLKFPKSTKIQPDACFPPDESGHVNRKKQLDWLVTNADDTIHIGF
jgi:hypothetical protein